MIHEIESKISKAAYSSKKDMPSALQKKESREIKNIDSRAVTGEEKLSKKAQEFLTALKEKYRDTDFFVSDQGHSRKMKEQMARSRKEISVMFSVDELEKMATDRDYANEKIQAMEQAFRISEKVSEKFGLEGSLNGGETYASKLGIAINDDGSTTIFTELQQLSKKQLEQIEKIRERNKEEDKEKLKEELAEILDEKYAQKRTTLSASSIDELIKSIDALQWNQIAGEPDTGSKYDFTV